MEVNHIINMGYKNWDVFWQNLTIVLLGANRGNICKPTWLANSRTWPARALNRLPGRLQLSAPVASKITIRSVSISTPPATTRWTSPNDYSRPIRAYPRFFVSNRKVTSVGWCSWNNFSTFVSYSIPSLLTRKSKPFLRFPRQFAVPVPTKQSRMAIRNTRFRTPRSSLLAGRLIIRTVFFRFHLGNTIFQLLIFLVHSL